MKIYNKLILATESRMVINCYVHESVDKIEEYIHALQFHLAEPNKYEVHIHLKKLLKISLSIKAFIQLNKD